jgi:hypothetical protein
MMDEDMKKINDMIEKKQKKRMDKLNRFIKQLENIGEDLKKTTFIQCEDCDEIMGMFFGEITIKTVICKDCKDSDTEEEKK